MHLYICCIYIYWQKYVIGNVLKLDSFLKICHDVSSVIPAYEQLDKSDK